MLHLGPLPVLNALRNKLSSPFVASVGLGLATSSYFFLGNLACATFGVVPAIKRNELEEGKKVVLWAYFYERAAVWFVTTTSITSFCFFTAAKFANPMYISLRPWLIFAGLCSFSIVPYTGFAMMPTNNELLATRNQVVQNKHSNLDGTSIVRLDNWAKLHLVRMIAGGISWAIGLTALILA